MKAQLNGQSSGRKLIETYVLSPYPSSVTLRKLLPFLNSRTLVYGAIARFFSNNKYSHQVFLIG
jgi:hypothetical protein